MTLSESGTIQYDLTPAEMESIERAQLLLEGRGTTVDGEALKAVAVEGKRSVDEIFGNLRKCIRYLTAPARIRNQNPHRPDRTMSGMPFKRGKGKVRW